MRRILAVAAALCLGATAADAQTWNGFYIGAHHGGGWSQTTWDNTTGVAIWPPVAGFPATGRTMGLFSGAQAGYSAQFGGFVVGAEVGFSGANVDGQTDCADNPAYGYICVSRLNWLATATARIGYGFQRTLFYMTGGLALARHSYDIQEPFFGTPSWGSGTERARGYTFGVGVERALSHGMSIRADYSYVRFGARDVVLTDPVSPDTTVTILQGYHFASVGFNFRFGGGDEPVTAGMGGGGWDVAVGKVEWLNFANYRFDLYDPFAPASQISRIVYSGSVGWSGEAFVRAQSPGGFFVNGMFGTGIAGGGTMVDEDFPPYIVPYSATLSDQHNGRLTYAGLDFGFTFIDRPRGSLGAFVGVTGMVERYQAYGCTQTASHPTGCVPSVPASWAVMTQTASSIGVRLGIAGELAMGERLAFRGQAAVLPLVYISAVDNHWLRPDINPLPESGRGFGYQLEAALDYQLTDRLNIGLGGRFWQSRVNGMASFPGLDEPQTTTSRHFGAFLEATYQLGN